MTERHHVWGGLTPAQREVLRNGGTLEPASWDEQAVVESWVGDFLLGASTSQIVETYGVTRDHVATVLEALLADKQALWREEECRGRAQFQSGPEPSISSESAA